MNNEQNLFNRILLTGLLLLQFSCSWVGIRTPSATTNTPSITIDEVLSIESSQEIGNKDFKEYFKNSLDFQGLKNAEYEFVLTNELPEKVSFKIELDVINDKYVYRFHHTKNAFKDHGAVYELGALMQRLKSNPALSHNLSMFEMYYNSKEGDVVALDNFLKIRAVKEVNYTSPFEEDLTENYLKRVTAFSEMRNELKPILKKQNTERLLMQESRKKYLDKLDKAPEGKQFRALVANGDRNGVADLLQKYLPFEDMAPFEKRFWDTHLLVMRKPVPLDQRVLIYRGLNDDYIHSAIVEGEELTKADAIKESKAFVMSSVLVKNQGSWNRRLRSLEAMNEKYIGTISDSSEYARSARISTIFLKHAGDPKGSPFLSLTPKIGVASSFGQKQLMSALVDPRLIHFNYVSSFTNEIEFLMPLTTFPDDMVGLWTSENSLEKEAFLEERLKTVISDKYGANKADDIIKRIKKNSSDLFSNVYKDGFPKIKNAPGESMGNFYKKFGKVKGTIRPEMTSKGDLTCKDLLKIFWGTLD